MPLGIRIVVISQIAEIDDPMMIRFLLLSVLPWTQNVMTPDAQQEARLRALEPSRRSQGVTYQETHRPKDDGGQRMRNEKGRPITQKSTRGPGE
jgi:hypothetical protein